MKISIELICLAIFLLVNLVTFFIYGADKRKAIKGKMRIPEKTLLLWSVFGPFGGCAGMMHFRHKTKKFVFVLVHFVMCLLHSAAFVAFLYYSR